MTIYSFPNVSSLFFNSGNLSSRDLMTGWCSTLLLGLPNEVQDAGKTISNCGKSESG